MPLQIVVPMAGEGRRFIEAGYQTPKPLVPVSGLPMVVRAVQDLPAAERVVFLVREEHIREHQVDRVLRTYLPNCRIIPVAGLTAGQAVTVRLAAEALEPDWPVIVAACDNTHLYDRERLLARMADPAVECLIWTYRQDPRVLVNPCQHGWVRVDGQRVLEVSCKRPISDRPLLDHAISGFFSFRSAGRMLEAIDRMTAANLRVNNEFYMDVAPNVLVAEGRRVEVFEVEKYIGWGTPADLEDFRKWERYFAQLHQRLV
jgi:CTP:molybdopterin cytidylyltransferase MocA